MKLAIEKGKVYVQYPESRLDLKYNPPRLCILLRVTRILTFNS